MKKAKKIKCPDCGKKKKHYSNGQCQSCYYKEYSKRPEVKKKRNAWMKEYTKRPEVKERMKEHQRKYLSKPENRERHNAHQRKYLSEYSKRPEVIKHRTEQEREKTITSCCNVLTAHEKRMRDDPEHLERTFLSEIIFIHGETCKEEGEDDENIQHD